jgi:hypothetical protein
MRCEVVPVRKWQRARFVAVVAVSAVAGAGVWKWLHPPPTEVARLPRPARSPTQSPPERPSRSAPPIDVQLGPADGELGELTADAIDRVIATHVELFERCYARGDWPTPIPQRTLHVQLTIDDNGAVTSESHGGLNNPPVGACVTRQIRNLVFPATGTPASIDYPIRFTPAY